MTQIDRLTTSPGVKRLTDFIGWFFPVMTTFLLIYLAYQFVVMSGRDATTAAIINGLNEANNLAAANRRSFLLQHITTQDMIREIEQRCYPDIKFEIKPSPEPTTLPTVEKPATLTQPVIETSK